MITPTSQAGQILAHLKTGKPITSMDAIMKFGCTRLAARISDIKDMGYTIDTIMKRKGSKSYAEYTLTGEPCNT